MDTKLKNKSTYIIGFIISIYLISLSFMSAFDFIINKEYLKQDAYFNSYDFENKLERYFENVRMSIIDFNQYSENQVNNKQRQLQVRKYLDSENFIRYYIKDEKSKKIYTNLQKVSNVKEYIKDKALYNITFPKDSVKDYNDIFEKSYINDWFKTNNFEGNFIILKDNKGYSQIQKNYKYYNSVKERLIKEGSIVIISLVTGLFILIYIIKNKIEEIYYIKKIRIWYEKIPLDIRIIIFIIYSIVILIYQSVISFFSMPIYISHTFKISIVACYVFYFILNIKSVLIFIKDKEKRICECRKSLIYKFINKSFIVKSIGTKVGIIFVLTVLLGIFIGKINIGNHFTFIIYLVYIVMYIIFILTFIIKKVSLLNKIIKGTNKIVDGNLNYEIEEQGKGDFLKLAHNINNMKEGFKKSVENQVKSERFKSELITNVSHDLKTPLTSIINYINLLKQEGLSKEEILDYIQVLDRKSQRLKILIDDLFEATKIASGSVELNIEKIDIVAIIRQALGEFDEKIKNSSLTFRVNIPKKNIYMNLDGKRSWRVFENLIGNILKYSLSNTRVYIDLKEENNKIKIIMKNISAYEMNFDVEEIFERFKRGDKSRNTEGSGLGLAIAKSIVEIQGGKMNINIDGDLFKVIIEFDK